MSSEQKSLRLVTFFSALCLFLAAVEYAIPKPLPFMRLGVANLPVLISLYVMTRRQTLALILFKVLAQSLITGTLFSYISAFSAAGSFASGLAMMAAHALLGKKNKISNIGLSLAGSLANNAAQIAMSYMFFFGAQTRYIVTPLLVAGTASGIIMGIFANAFCNKSKWYNAITSGNSAGEVSPPLQPAELSSASPSSGGDPRNAPQSAFKTYESRQSTSTATTAKIQFITAAILYPLFLFSPKIIAFVTEKAGVSLSPFAVLKIIWLCVAVFFAMTFVKRHGKVKVLPSVLVTVFITLFALLSPSGKVLFVIRGLQITQDALLLGLRKSATLVGMVFLSQFAISPRLELPGKVGKFVQEVFVIFEALTANKIHFKRGQIISSLDEKLCSLMQANK